MAVTPATIAVELGVAAPQPGSEKDEQWSLWIADAYMLIEARRLKLDADLPDEMKLDYVVRKAVVAHVRRPDDSTQVSIQQDDSQVSRQYSSSAGRVQILDEWWLLLGLIEQGKAFSIDTAPGHGGPQHADDCSLRFGAVFCSCGAYLTGWLPLWESL